MTDLTDAELQLLLDVVDLARAGDTARLVEALGAGVPANLTTAAGDSLLILAAYHTHPETVAALLTGGADHARVNDRGQTALGAATFRQSEQIVAMLLRAGADPDLGSPSARDLAVFFELPHMTKLLDGA